MTEGKILMGARLPKVRFVLSLLTIVLVMPAMAATQLSKPDQDLFTAITIGNAAGVTLALSQGANIEVNEFDNNVSTPLESAYEMGKVDMMKLLLEHHANTEVKRAGGATMLWGAAATGNIAAARLLLAYHANIEAKDDRTGETPLLAAALTGHTDIVNLLLERHADAAARDKEGHTWMQLANMIAPTGTQNQGTSPTAQAQPLAQSSAAQQTGILELDCSGPGLIHAWIDENKSFVTVQGQGDTAMQYPGDGSFPAQITPTSITWTPNNYYGLPLEITINRTAGTIRWHILPNNQGSSLDRTDSCIKGSTPFPGTKF